MTGRSPRRRAHLVVLILPLLLTACQSVVSPEGESGTLDGASIEQLTSRHEALLSSRDEFEVGGGLGIWTDEESISARITWLQRPDALQLDLVGPLGIGTMQLLESGGVSSLTRGDQTLARGNNADKVLQQGLGLIAPVPLHELSYWVRGLPGEASSVVRDDQGKLSSLRFTDEQGTQWQARFKRYSEWDGVPVPALITASGGPYSVRLLLKNWQYATTTVVPETSESNNRLPIPGR